MVGGKEQPPLLDRLKGMRLFHGFFGQKPSRTPFSPPKIVAQEKIDKAKGHQAENFQAFSFDMLGPANINVFAKLGLSESSEQGVFVAAFIGHLPKVLDMLSPDALGHKISGEEEELTKRLKEITPYLTTATIHIPSRQAHALSHTARLVAIALINDYRQAGIMKKFAQECISALDTKDTQNVLFDRYSYSPNPATLESINRACAIYKRDIGHAMQF